MFSPQSLTNCLLLLLFSYTTLTSAIAGGKGKTRFNAHRSPIPTLFPVININAASDCSNGSLWCDGRCVDRAFLCDTYYDCTGGSDEANCANTTCRTDEFRCSSGNCVDQEKVCNGRFDCKDDSDEPSNCTLLCSNGSLWCDGKCVGRDKVCDSYHDCTDGRDEANCTLLCSNGSLWCDGKCVGRGNLCDTYHDCTDGRDETNCANTTCRTDEFRCSSGNCVDQEKVCNGRFDCKDRSDEPSTCPTVKVPICDSSELGCVGGGCVALAKACDGVSDCPDASDERPQICNKTTSTGTNTTTLFPGHIPCPPTEHQCSNGQCVLMQGKSVECDGFPDCVDASDENELHCASKCKAGEFKCQAGQCIRENQLCDGVIDCMDGSDEKKLTCATCPLPQKLSCSSGIECFMKEERCDGVVDCNDKSDENDCATCQGNSSICIVSRQCLGVERKCNHIIDCPDGSDEKGCACQAGWHRCQNAHCIPGAFMCDGRTDCPRADDEETEMCRKKCSVGHYQCREGRCIEDEAICDGAVDCLHGEDESNDFCRQAGKCLEGVHWKCEGEGGCIFKEWVCDGTPDCAGGEDEEKEACAEVECKESEFECAGERRCIEGERRCDGKQDCSDSSDELACATSSQLVGMTTEGLFVRRGDEVLRMCADYSTSVSARHWVCNYLAISTRTERLRMADINNTHVIALKHNYTYYNANNINSHLTIMNSCKRGFYHVNCSKLECGIRRLPNSIVPNIVNGFKADAGSWPWHVSLKMKDGRMCGGSVLSQSLILTSADCVSHMGRRMSASSISAHVGSILLDGAGGQKANVSKVMLHPYYDWSSQEHNIALLVVERPLRFSDNVKPICLPDALRERRYRSCRVAGFGNTRYDGFKSPFLLEARMILMTQRQCILSLNLTQNSTSHPVLPHVDYRHHLCAGFYPSIGSNVCKGDSGGPLVCETLEGYWEQVGVVEHYHNNEGCRSSVFTNVKANLNFIYIALNQYSR